MNWHTETRAVSTLKDHPQNPREFTERGMADLRASIKSLGYVEPIAVNTDGTILSGHARCKVLLEAGLTEVEVRVPERALTDAEQREVLVRLNKNQAGAWDMDILSDVFEIQDLKEWGFDDKDLGLDTLPEVKEDEAPEVSKREPLVKRGDVFRLGRHRVICGDSTSADDVATVLNGAEPVLMVTDPPYGVEYDPEWRADRGLKSRGTGSTGKVENDDRAGWAEAYSLFTGQVAYVWHAHLFTETVWQDLRDCGFLIVQPIVWSKPAFAISRSDYHWQHEPCAYAVRKGKTHNWQGSRKESTVWQIGKTKDNEDAATGHGTQKPVECMLRPIRNNTQKGQDVYDPFLGSGTTLIAAEQSGRTCYGLEISPNYVEAIIRRWANLGGTDFEHVNGSLTLADITGNA